MSPSNANAIARDRRGALSRGVARVIGSRFAKPIARVVLVAAGLVLLAAVGHAGAAGRFGGASVSTAIRGDASAEETLASASPMSPMAPVGPTAAALPNPSGARGRASVDDPVVLNTAASEDLRRLPGIGQKRADAILALRARLGRFRAVEDLMKVKGIGRAMLKRLRPLVRLDPAPSLLDGGAAPVSTNR